MARPSKYNEKLADKICLLLSTTSQGLNTICKAKDMPSTVTVYDWLNKDKEFLNRYAHAREAQADLLADEVIEIADDSSEDMEVTIGEDGVKTEKPNSENIQRSRLRVDARKWKAAKLSPKKYGEKIQQEITTTTTKQLYKLDENTTIEFGG